MYLWALSDLHVERDPNRGAIEALSPRPNDWLILAGDVGESVEAVAWTLDVLRPKFARLLWVPGNHELWTGPKFPVAERGEGRYRALVAACRERGVVTPEDPYPEWPPSRAGASPLRIAPLFLLYDYSFAPPDHRGQTRAREWAGEHGILAADEHYVDPSPHPSRTAWCHARVQETEARLEQAARTHELILVNHWPLRHDLVRLGRVPRYAPWCGTRLTDDWHRRFRARACVHGHLHVRATDERDGTRFEEVSLGYPAHWDQAKGADAYLRRIL